jgi:DNA-binding IclR family transcriptional regulator
VPGSPGPDRYHRAVPSAKGRTRRTPTRNRSATAPVKKSDRQAPGPQSARRLLDILTQFTVERPVHSVDDLAERTRVPRSTAYRFVTLLREYGLLETGSDAQYQLGPRAITLGYVARSLVDMADLWRPVLGDLVGETHETALVMRRVGDYAVCIDRAESDHPVRLSFEIGRTMPLHHGAGAKVLLAYAPNWFKERYVDEVVPAKEQPGLRRQLVRILDDGVVDSSSEVDPGIWATAAPLCEAGSDPPLALSVAVPDYRLDGAGRERVRKAVVSSAASLRTLLHHYG